MRLVEFILATGLAVSLYAIVLNVVPRVTTPTDPSDYWGYLPSLWDHPEPNYVFTPHIAELWSVLTTIPIAGFSLLYQSYLYRFDASVVGLFVIVTWMYTCAFTAHMTLSPLIMSVTLTSVLTNGIYTFYQFAFTIHLIFATPFITLSISALAFIVIVYLVITLPPLFGEFGGVPTLTVVQTPAVIIATVVAHYLLLSAMKSRYKFRRSRRREQRTSMGIEAMHNSEASVTLFRLLRGAGLLLILAMAISFLEVALPRDSAVIFNHFPYLHVCIHILEQIGIYAYGCGVAGLKYVVIEKESGAEIRFTAGFIPYVYRPSVLPKFH